VTVVGYAASEDQIVSREGAAPGDVVALTGTLGGSRAALEAITSGDTSSHLDRQFHPTPRFAAGAALAANRATAMIDISDGLAKDAQNIAAASNVAIEIELKNLPCAEGTTAVQAAESGEEYELLVTLAPEHLDSARRAVEATGTTLTEIGCVLEGSEANFLGTDGRPVAVAGYQHFD
jgi:thiamine-monophosphate kinase